MPRPVTQIDPEKAKEAMALFEPLWEVLEAHERERLIRLVVQRVVYNGQEGEITAQFCPMRLGTLARETEGNVEVALMSARSRKAVLGVA